MVPLLDQEEATPVRAARFGAVTFKERRTVSEYKEQTMPNARDHVTIEKTVVKPVLCK
jgi:hypothetical protein